VLQDPVLNEIEKLALASAPDLAAAQARTAQARATLRSEKANRWPTAGVQATTIQGKLPGLDLQRETSPQTTAPPEDSSSLSFYNFGLNANWEIGLAGAEQRKVESANALLAAAVANEADAHVQLTAEVALVYVDLREQQSRRSNLREQFRLQQEVLKLQTQRFERGVIPAFAVGEADTQLQSIAADIAASEAEVTVSKYTLAVLCGQWPGQLDVKLAEGGAIPLPPEQVQIGELTSLLQRRPDVRAAERNLAASTARIGIATASRFPKLSFMGILGVGGTSLSEFDFGNPSMLAIPQLQWGLLDFGRSRAAIDRADAGRQESEAQYEKTVLAALQDAESSLARFGQQRATSIAFLKIRDSANRALALNQDRFDAGVISTGDLNVSARQKLAAQVRFDQSTAALTKSFIAVQKSLGLGWRNPGF